MTRHSVKSSDVASIGFRAVYAGAHLSDAYGVMVVEFRKGGVYEYYDIPVHVYRSIRTAESIGSALHKLVKTASYAYKRVA